MELIQINVIRVQAQQRLFTSPANTFWRRILPGYLPRIFVKYSAKLGSNDSLRATTGKRTT